MKNSIQHFSEDGIKNLEKAQENLAMNPDNLASYIQVVKDEVINLGLEIIQETLETFDEMLRNSSLRKEKWEIVRKDTTPCFVEGGWIPDYNAGFGEDQSPEFHIEGIDPKAETMVITLDDLGHPLEPGYNHWVAWNIKPADCIPGGIPKEAPIFNYLQKKFHTLKV